MEISLARPLPSGVGTVTQWFGENPARYARFGAAGHLGTDYAARVGTPILAAQSGKVLRVGNDPNGYGLYIVIDHGHLLTRYSHLSRSLVSIGQEVGISEQIAVIGNSGNSTGTHLDFELVIKGMRNPAYLGRCDSVPFRDI